MVEFTVKGPYDVPVKVVGSSARFVDKELLRSLLSQSDGAIAKAGCYVFSLRAARGCIPVYVGKATRNILREAFNDRNCNNLAEYINARQRGRLQISIVHQNKMRLLQGNKDCIADIEEYLIGYAARRNPDLINIHGTGGASWSIKGVNNGRGAPAAVVAEFKEMMGIAKRRTVTKATNDEDSIEPSNTEPIAATNAAEDNSEPSEAVV